MRLVFWLICVLGLSVPAEAAEVLKQVPASLDSRKAYILVEISAAQAPGGKVPASLTLARYDRDGGDVRGGLRSPGSALPKGETIRIVIASRPLVKTKHSRLYLVALEPDTWVIEGAGTTAFSLGSYSFVAGPGAVLDLGVVSPNPDWREGDNAGKEMRRIMTGAILFGALGGKGEPTPWKADHRVRLDSDVPIPAPLKTRVTDVSFEKGAKFGNYLGGLVNRIEGRAGREAALASVDDSEAAAPAESGDATGLGEAVQAEQSTSHPR